MLSTAPGPSPWYSAGWTSPGDCVWKKDAAGLVRCETPNGRELVALPMCTWLLGAAPGEITVLRNDEYLVRVTTHRLFPTNRVAHECFLPTVSEACELATPVLCTASVPTEMSFPISLPVVSGSTRLDHSDSGRSRVGPPSAATALCVWWPREGRARFVPLAWFNEDSMDLGYQWITRCARDPETGWMFGDGIRVDPFAVDESGELRWQKSGRA